MLTIPHSTQRGGTDAMDLPFCLPFKKSSSSEIIGSSWESYFFIGVWGKGVVFETPTFEIGTSGSMGAWAVSCLKGVV